MSEGLKPTFFRGFDLFTVFLSLIFGATGAVIMSRHAHRIGFVDLPNERSSHTFPTPRGGGIGLLAAFLFLAYSSSMPLYQWGPAVALSLVSFYDDFFDLSARLKLFIHFLASAFFMSGIVILSPGIDIFFLVPIGILFMVTTTNFFNFMDGIDGIATLAAVVAFGLLGVFTLLTASDPNQALTPIVMLAACLGFLPFNCPCAKVFMGDVGSVLLGFVFSVQVVTLSQNLADFICFASFMFPFYADGFVTLWIRWRDGEPLTQAHRRHLYQILCNELKMSHLKVACGYATLQLFVATLMIVCYQHNLLWQIAWLTLCSLLFVCVGQKIRNRV